MYVCVCVCIYALYVCLHLQLYRYTWIAGPVDPLNDTIRMNMCIKSTVNITIAKSPAFDIKGKPTDH